MRALALSLLLAASAVDAAAAPLVYGFNFPTWWKDNYAQPWATESLRRMAATGANWVAITPTWYAKSRSDSTISRTQATPTDESIRTVIRNARGLGLHVLLKPHVDIETGGPRAFIRPSDKDLWFKEYESFILHYARIAEEEGCAMFSVGTELFLTSGYLNTPRWKKVIAKVRKAYSGKLTYAANWYDVGRVQFWDQLDFIGVDAYYPVMGTSPGELRLGWIGWRNILAMLSLGWGRPVLITEVGLSAQKSAQTRPWDYGDFGELDLKIQHDYLAAFLDVFHGHPWYAGFLQWAWEADPNAGGMRDKSMTVQGKPAEKLLSDYFKRQNPPPLGPLLQVPLESLTSAGW